MFKLFILKQMQSKQSFKPMEFMQKKSNLIFMFTNDDFIKQIRSYHTNTYNISYEQVIIIKSKNN